MSHGCRLCLNSTSPCRPWTPAFSASLWFPNDWYSWDGALIFAQYIAYMRETRLVGWKLGYIISESIKIEWFAFQPAMLYSHSNGLFFLLLVSLCRKDEQPLGLTVGVGLLCDRTLKISLRGLMHFNAAHVVFFVLFLLVS